MLDIFTPRWGYILRSLLAAVLALGIAYALQLETPYSAASTVLLVANANHGAVLAKGGWRLLGTLIGGTAALVLMGLFIQTPTLFILGFALWLGLCTGGAMLFRHFRASGAAVAGYTVGLATYGALEAPERALDAVLGRTATVALGVVCLGVVTALFSKRATRPRLEAALMAQFAAVAAIVLDRLEKGNTARAPLRPEQIGALFAIDDLLELSGAESPDVATRAGAVRDCIAALFGAMLGASDLRDRCDPAEGLAEACGLVVAALPRIVKLIEGRGFLEAMREADALSDRLREHVGFVESAVRDTSARLIALDRLVEVVEDYGTALAGLAALHGGGGPAPQPFRFHRDWGGAVENGLRSMLAILLAGAFGIVTGWSDWSLLLLILAPYSVLLAMTGNPAAGAIEFIKGTIVAVPVAFVCAFGLLPTVQGFPLLVAVIAPFWMAGLYATTIPRYAPAALAYLVAFNTLVGANNPMVFSMSAFLNQAFGWIAAVVVTLLVFRLLLPHDPRRQARRIETALRRDVLAVLRPRGRIGRAVWEHLQHHRLVRIALSLKADPTAAAPMLADGIAGLHLGRAAMRVHAAAAQPVVSQALRGATMEALAAASRSPRDAREALTSEAAEIASRPADDPVERAAAHRIAAGLADMVTLIAAHADWLEGRPGRASC